MDSLTVALGQMDIVCGEPEPNHATAAAMAGEAAGRGAHLFVLPELWASGYDLANADAHADELDRGSFALMAELARSHGMAVCGSHLERREDGIYNTLVLYSARGERCGTYRKIHLIGLMEEDRYLRPGAQPALGEGDWDGAGLAICYDLRFPELWRWYGLRGAKLAIIPAEWPIQRIEHWRTLLRARAIENQMAIIACNRVGHDQNNQFGGCSALINPWGDVIVEGGSSAKLIVGALDLTMVAHARQFLPVFADRRPEAYGESDHRV